MSTHHQDYMTIALELAKQGQYTVSPNPMVGCVIVKNQQVIATGYHHYCGEAHAEIHALQAAKEDADNSIVYVNLEPCCHVGKTGACTAALIAAKVKKVVIATLDPNPLVCGKGIQALREAGIEVEIGVLEKEAKKLNEIFFHYMTHRQPFVIAKWAMSLDGKTITHAQDSREISHQESNEATHLLRQQVDAILIGANTAVKDNPWLTVRTNKISSNLIKHPLRVIVTTHGNLPLDLNVFQSNPATTLVATTKLADPAWCEQLKNHHIEVLILPHTVDDRVDLLPLLNTLGARGITSLLVEGGMTLHQDFLQKKLVNKLQVILAPVIIGDLTQKTTLSSIHLEKLGLDYHLTVENLH